MTKIDEESQIAKNVVAEETQLQGQLGRLHGAISILEEALDPLLIPRTTDEPQEEMPKSHSVHYTALETLIYRVLELGARLDI